MNACFANINDPSNVGDFSSSPLNYFKFPFETTKVHFHKKLPRSDILVLGGGGLLYFSTKIWNKLKDRSKVFIGWGLGSNDDGGNHVEESEAREGFSLWGRRMWDHGRPNPEWVPCSSCMSDLFLANYKIRHEYICYEHHSVPIKLEFPTLRNNVKLEQAIEFIGSGNTVITNSYHGAYWATLLKRRVIVLNPTSTKFDTLKHRPVIADKFEPGMERKSRIFPNALHECRIANINFYHKVLEVAHETQS